MTDELTTRCLAEVREVIEQEFTTLDLYVPPTRQQVERLASRLARMLAAMPAGMWCGATHGHGFDVDAALRAVASAREAP